MNPHQILRLFPNASRATIAANAADYGQPHADGGRQAAELEPSAKPRALAAGAIEKKDTKRISVRIESVRRRLLDEDNLCEKYHVDCCRYAGLLPADSPDKVSIQATQRKAEKGEAEHVKIEIINP